MLELISGLGLSAAAGLNAYIPMLVLGLAGRFLDFVELPQGWAWLSNEWVLVILGVLLVVEIIADKVPVVDTVNDWIQTVVRPASGGIVFGTGASTQTNAIQDPAAFFENNNWVPIVIGIVISLAVHIGKMSIRPALNAVTAGVAAPVVSTVEDIGSVILAVLAIVFPILVIIAIVVFVAIFVSFATRALRSKAAQRSADAV